MNTKKQLSSKALALTGVLMAGVALVFNGVLPDLLGTFSLVIFVVALAVFIKERKGKNQSPNTPKS